MASGAGGLGPNGIGEGRIDNLLIDSSAHVVTGAGVLVAMVAAAVLVGVHAWRNEAIGRPAGLAIGASVVALTAQALIGIKLLDQGQGITQLYIHYIGGLAPLGAFLLAGWVARGGSGPSSRVLAALIWLGLLSALMAFTIGRAYANSFG